MARLSTALLVAAVASAPLAGVGLVALVTGHGIGTGLQPAFVPLALVVPLWLLRRTRTVSEDAWWVLAALAWTLMGTSLLWPCEDVGLAGEVAWTKALKQGVLLGFFVAVGMTPPVLLARARNRGEMLRRVERATTLGLAFAVGIGLLQAIHFHLPIPGFTSVDGWLRSNPSIAAGSEELYLGHRFVGIARVRGPFPEPLHFGSYLLVAAPITLAAGFVLTGWSRIWRLVVGLGGLACLVMTFSRGAYLGAVVLVCTLGVGVASGRLPRPAARVTLVVAALGTVGLAALSSLATGGPPWELGTLLVRRVLQGLADHDMSNLTRFYAWGAAWQLFLAHPVAGAGWGAFGFHYFTLTPEGGSAAHFGWPVTNNVPLLVLAETGVVGMLVWGRAVWPAFCGAISRRKVESSTPEDSLRFALAALCVASLAQALTFSQWNLPHLWLLAGFSAAIGRAGPGMPRSVV